MNKFLYENKDEIKSCICPSCKNWFGSDRCKAFPDKSGIPNEILVGENDHKKPFQGDNGIQYEKFD